MSVSGGDSSWFLIVGALFPVGRSQNSVITHFTTSPARCRCAYNTLPRFPDGKKLAQLTPLQRAALWSPHSARQRLASLKGSVGSLHLKATDMLVGDIEARGRFQTDYVRNCQLTLNVLHLRRLHLKELYWSLCAVYSNSVQQLHCWQEQRTTCRGSATQFRAL